MDIWVSGVFNTRGFLIVENDALHLGIYDNLQIWVFPASQSGVEVPICCILPLAVGRDKAQGALDTIFGIESSQIFNLRIPDSRCGLDELYVPPEILIGPSKPCTSFGPLP